MTHQGESGHVEGDLAVDAGATDAKLAESREDPDGVVAVDPCEIVGAESSDELLGRIFARFCVGK